MSNDIDNAFKQWSDSNPARTFEDAFKAGVAYGKSTQDDYWARFKDHEIRSLDSQLALLKKIIEVLEKSNGYYADIISWDYGFDIGSADWEDVHHGPGIGDFYCDVGGKRARQALVEVEKLKQN